MDNATARQVIALKHHAQTIGGSATGTINGHTVTCKVTTPPKRYAARWTVNGHPRNYSDMSRIVAEPVPVASVMTPHGFGCVVRPVAFPEVTAARTEAIAEADAHVTNVGLPSYSDLLALARTVSTDIGGTAERARRLLGTQS